MRKIHLFIPILGLVLAACGAGGPTGSAPGQPEAPTAPAAATVTPNTLPTATVEPTLAPTEAGGAQLATPRATPEPRPTAPADQPGAELVEQARQALAAHLGIDAGMLTLKEASPQQWSDGSLGCPAPDMMYPQVIVPGFLISLTDRTRDYEIHTGRAKEQMVLCENKLPINLAADGQDAQPTPAARPTAASGLPGLVPTPLPAEGSNAPFDEDSKRMLGLAQQALAKDQGIDVADITLVNIQPVEWNDGSLGCPQPGANYLQVITPGYLITLEAQGQRYDYHTDQRGRAVRCDRKLP